MRVLVTGVAGQLGHDVMNELIARNVEAYGTDLKEVYSGIPDGSAVTAAPYVPMDITDEASVKAVFETVRPDALIHCAAWTAVDAAEDEENRPKVFAVNVTGTENLAKAAGAADAKMLFISTDYVFNGQGETPWEADCTDYAPLSYYGKTKAKAEVAVTMNVQKFFIVRIAWVFGLNGSNFIKTMLRVGKTHGEVRVVNDQIGTPTYTRDLSRLLVDMILSEKYGYYNATNEGGYISWYDFTKEIYRQAGMATRVTPVTTEEYGLSKAKRPCNSRLDRKKLALSGFTPLPDWKDAVHRYLVEIGEISSENAK